MALTRTPSEPDLYDDGWPDADTNSLGCYNEAIRALRQRFLMSQSQKDGEKMPDCITHAPATAEQIARRAAELVGGDRQKSHGNKTENHQNIAGLWNAYLGWRLDGDCRLTPKDVALMMVLLKVARTKAGSHNPDDYVDAAGYAAVAGEIAGAGK